MIRIALIVVLLLVALPAWACIPFTNVVAEATQIWSEVVDVRKGDDAKAFLASLRIQDQEADAVIVLRDPKDGEILVVGFANGCHRGHLTFPSLEAMQAIIAEKPSRGA